MSHIEKGEDPEVVLHPREKKSSGAAWSSQASDGCRLVLGACFVPHRLLGSPLPRFVRPPGTPW